MLDQRYDLQIDADFRDEEECCKDHRARAVIEECSILDMTSLDYGVALEKRILAIAADGSKLGYFRAGLGIPVVLIQGTGLTGHAWAPQIAELAKTRDVIWIDNRGIGDSRYAEVKNLTIDLMAQDVLAVMNDAGVECAHIVGHSLGGLIAQRVAALAPKRIFSLSLLCTFNFGRNAVLPRLDSLWPMLCTTIGTSTSKRRAFARLVSSETRIQRKTIDQLVEQLESIFQRPLDQLPSIVSKQLAAMWKHTHLEDLSKLEKESILVVAGAADKIAPPYFSKEIANTFGCRFDVVQNEGHALPIENAKILNEMLTSHFQMLENRSGKTRLTFSKM